MTPYRHRGKATLTQFDSRTLSANDSTATVEMTKFVVEVKGRKCPYFAGTSTATALEYTIAEPSTSSPTR
jgi:hypothetical protein